MPKAFNSAISTAAKKRAQYAAHAADHDHDEGFGNDGQIHAERYRLVRHFERAAKSGQRGADEERYLKQAVGAHAQRLQHLAIFGGSPHQHAEPGACKHPPDPTQHR